MLQSHGWHERDGRRGSEGKGSLLINFPLAEMKESGEQWEWKMGRLRCLLLKCHKIIIISYKKEITVWSIGTCWEFKVIHQRQHFLSCMRTFFVQKLFQPWFIKDIYSKYLDHISDGHSFRVWKMNPVCKVLKILYLYGDQGAMPVIGKRVFS